MACTSVRCQSVTAILLVIFGLLFIIIAVAGRSPLSHFIDTLIQQKMVLAPATDTFENWSDPPVPLYDDVYVFNITNPVQFKNGSKASIDLVGPFVYQKIEIKASANVSGDLKYAMYYDQQTFFYKEDETLLKNNKTKLTDRIYIPNIPLLTVLSMLDSYRHIPSSIIKELEDLIALWEEHKNISAVLNGTIQEVLWGLDDPIMKKMYELKLSPIPKLALQVNGSIDPAAMTVPTLVYTGHSDADKVAEYHMFHGRNDSGCWATHAANVINGTEGTMFSPLLIYNKTKSLTIYNEQLFRSVDLEYVKEDVYNGITCYNYQIPDWALQNISNNPANAGYYAYIYSGMLNLTQCSSGVPLYMTKAMFLDADKRLLENVTMNVVANRSLHDTYLCVEPYTGAVIDAHKRVQINIEISRYKNTELLGKVKPAFVPVVYVDEHGSITESLTETLNNSLLIPILVTHVMFYVLCSAGTVLVLCSVLLHVKLLLAKYSKAGPDNEALVTNEEVPQSDNIQRRNSAENSEYLSFDGRTSKYYDPIS